jgi:hypothetical protein
MHLSVLRHGRDSKEPQQPQGHSGLPTDQSAARGSTDGKSLRSELLPRSARMPPEQPLRRDVESSRSQNEIESFFNRKSSRSLVVRRFSWWARQDSNLQPDRYERNVLTIEAAPAGEEVLAPVQTYVALSPAWVAQVQTYMASYRKWRTRHDSNVWPSPSEGDALSS